MMINVLSNDRPTRHESLVRGDIHTVTVAGHEWYHKMATTEETQHVYAARV